MIILGRTKNEWKALELQYRPEWIIFLVGFILGAIIFQMNKQLQKQNLNQDDIEYTIYQTGLNLLAANGLCKLWMLKDYKQKQQRESYDNLRQCENIISKG